MTYRLYYGDLVSMLRYARSEQFSTEHEPLQRARELLEEDCAATVAIYDAAGNPAEAGLSLRVGWALANRAGTASLPIGLAGSPVGTSLIRLDALQFGMRGPLWHWFAEHLMQNGRGLRQAPLVFALTLLIAGIGAYWLAGLRYNEVVEQKNAETDALRTQVSELQISSETS